MTVAANSAAFTVVGDGATRRYPLQFPVFDGATVYAIAKVTGVQLGGHVDGVDFLLDAAPAAGVVVAIYRYTPIAQPRGFPNTGSLRPKALEAGLDKLTAIAQEARSAVDREVQDRIRSDVALEELIAALPTDGGPGVLPDIALADFPHAVARPLVARFSDKVSIRDFAPTAGSDAADYTAALNTALADIAQAGRRRTLWLPGGAPIMVSEAFAGAGYCILNKGVPIEGDGQLGSQITAKSTVGPTVDVMRFRPDPDSGVDFMRFEKFMLNPNGAAGRSLYCLFDQHCFVNNFLLNMMYMGPSGRGYSLEIYNDPAVNPQGAPFLAQIKGGYYSEGIKVSGVSDSFEIDTLIRTNLTSNIGFEYTGVIAGDGSNPAHLDAVLNVDAKGGAVLLHSGRHPRIHLDAEQTQATGTSNGAVIELRGDAARIIEPQITGAVGVFGTSAVTSMVRIGNVQGGRIDAFGLLASPSSGGYTHPRDAVFVTAAATDFAIGSGEMPVAGGTTYDVNDLGGGTRGLSLTLTPQTGFANVGGGFGVALAKKGLDGRVVLGGYLSCPTSPAGKLVTVLPTGCRPANTEVFPCHVVTTSGTFAINNVQVSAGGVVTYYGDNNAATISLAGIVFDTNQWSKGSL